MEVFISYHAICQFRVYLLPFCSILSPLYILLDYFTILNHVVMANCAIINSYHSCKVILLRYLHVIESYSIPMCSVGHWADIRMLSCGIPQTSKNYWTSRESLGSGQIYCRV